MSLRPSSTNFSNHDQVLLFTYEHATIASDRANNHLFEKCCPFCAFSPLDFKPAAEEIPQKMVTAILGHCSKGRRNTGLFIWRTGLYHARYLSDTARMAMPRYVNAVFRRRMTL